jgi:hypothetical protein
MPGSFTTSTRNATLARGVAGDGALRGQPANAMVRPTRKQ